MSVLAILIDTWRELVYRKAIPVYFGIITLAHLFILIALQTDVVDGMVSSVKVMGLQGSTGELRIEDLVSGAQLAIAYVLFPLGILMSLFATASLVPRMLEKGSVDLLLSKPISRPVLFASRYLAALVVASSSLIYLVTGILVILGFKTGVWNGGFFLAGIMMSIYFASLLGYAALAGVLSRSTSVAIMVTAVLFFLGLIVRFPHESTDWPMLITSRAWRFAALGLVETLFHALPRTEDFRVLVNDLTLGRQVTILGPVLNSLLAGGGALGLAMLYFSKKDF